MLGFLLLFSLSFAPPAACRKQKTVNAEPPGCGVAPSSVKVQHGKADWNVSFPSPHKEWCAFTSLLSFAAVCCNCCFEPLSVSVRWLSLAGEVSDNVRQPMEMDTQSEGVDQKLMLLVNAAVSLSCGC